MISSGDSKPSEPVLAPFLVDFGGRIADILPANPMLLSRTPGQGQRASRPELLTAWVLTAFLCAITKTCITNSTPVPAAKPFLNISSTRL